MDKNVTNELTENGVDVREVEVNGVVAPVGGVQVGPRSWRMADGTIHYGFKKNKDGELVAKKRPGRRKSS